MYDTDIEVVTELQSNMEENTRLRNEYLDARIRLRSEMEEGTRILDERIDVFTKIQSRLEQTSQKLRQKLAAAKSKATSESTNTIQEDPIKSEQHEMDASMYHEISGYRGIAYSSLTRPIYGAKEHGSDR